MVNVVSGSCGRLADLWISHGHVVEAEWLQESTVLPSKRECKSIFDELSAVFFLLKLLLCSPDDSMCANDIPCELLSLFAALTFVGR